MFYTFLHSQVKTKYKKSTQNLKPKIYFHKKDMSGWNTKINYNNLYGLNDKTKSKKETRRERSQLLRLFLRLQLPSDAVERSWTEFGHCTLCRSISDWPRVTKQTPRDWLDAICQSARPLVQRHTSREKLLLRSSLSARRRQILSPENQRCL